MSGAEQDHVKGETPQYIISAPPLPRSEYLCNFIFTVVCGSIGECLHDLATIHSVCTTTYHHTAQVDLSPDADGELDSLSLYTS